MTITGTMVLIGYLGWAAWVFGVTTLRRYRTTGDVGIRRTVSTPVGRAAKPLMVGGLISVGVGACAASIGAWTILQPPVILRIIAAVVFAASATGSIVAQLDMGRSWRIGVDPGERTALVTTGMFAIVRNPFFTASIALTYATVVLAPTWPTLLGAIAFTVGVNLQVRIDEEPALLALHGDAYRAYTREVGRFLPRIATRTRARPPRA